MRRFVQPYVICWISILWILILGVVDSNSFDTRSMCNLMLPFDVKPENIRKESSPAYEIKVLNQFGREVKEYEPGWNRTVQVVVRGHQPFAGVILQARSVTDGSRRIGAVLRPTPDGSRILNCDGEKSSSAVWYRRQNQAASVYRAKFTWALPATDLGPFRFRASILDDESILWTNVESQMVFPASHFYSTPFDDPLKSSGLFSCHSVNLDDSRRRCFTGACRGFDLVCKFSVQWKCYGGQVLYRFKTLRFRPPLPNHRHHRNGGSDENLRKDYANHGIYIGLALSDNNVSTLYDRLILCEWLNKSGEIANGERKDAAAMTTKFRTYVMHPGIGYPVPFRDDSVEKIDVTSTSRDFGCKILRKENVNSGRTSETANLSFVWGYMNADGYPEKPSPNRRIYINDSRSHHCSPSQRHSKAQKLTSFARKNAQFLDSIFLQFVLFTYAICTKFVK